MTIIERNGYCHFRVLHANWTRHVETGSERATHLRLLCFLNVLSKTLQLNAPRGIFLSSMETKSSYLFARVHKRGFKQFHTVQQLFKGVRLFPEFTDRFDEHSARCYLDVTVASGASYRSSKGLVWQVDYHERRVLVEVRPMSVISSQKRVHGVNVLLL